MKGKVRRVNFSLLILHSPLLTDSSFLCTADMQILEILASVRAKLMFLPCVFLCDLSVSAVIALFGFAGEAGNH
jgi:hypothetical protein